MYLSAPNPSGAGAELLFWQDPLNPNPYPPHNINGAQDGYVNGTIYLGEEDVVLSGGLTGDQTLEDGACLSIIAGTFDLNGGPDLNLATEGCGFETESASLGTVVRLVD